MFYQHKTSQIQLNFCKFCSGVLDYILQTYLGWIEPTESIERGRILHDASSVTCTLDLYFSWVVKTAISLLTLAVLHPCWSSPRLAPAFDGVCLPGSSRKQLLAPEGYLPQVSWRNCYMRPWEESLMKTAAARIWQRSARAAGAIEWWESKKHRWGKMAGGEWLSAVGCQAPKF